MNGIPSIISSIAQAVFPLVRDHVSKTDDVITFEVTASNQDEDDCQVYRISVYDDVMIQTRVDEKSKKSIVLGMKGKRVMEATLDTDDDDVINAAVTQIAASINQ